MSLGRSATELSQLTAIATSESGGNRDGRCGVCLRYLCFAILGGIGYWAVLDNLIDYQNGQYWILIFSETGQAEYMNKNWDCIHVP